MGKVMHIIMIFVFIFLTVALLFFAYYLYYVTFSSQAGAVYYPSKIETVRKMLALAGVREGDVVLDLGSGDGRILVEAAKLGARAIGYENDPVLVWQSRKKIQKKGLSNLAEVRFGSFYKADFNEGTIITLYLFPKYMDRLQKILDKKLTKPILIVSNDYQFPRKKYFKRGRDIFLYKFP